MLQKLYTFCHKVWKIPVDAVLQPDMSQVSGMFCSAAKPAVPPSPTPPLFLTLWRDKCWVHPCRNPQSALSAVQIPDASFSYFLTFIMVGGGGGWGRRGWVRVIEEDLQLWCKDPLRPGGRINLTPSDKVDFMSELRKAISLRLSSSPVRLGGLLPRRLTLQVQIPLRCRLHLPFR